jgi:hypothetical protein
MIKSITTAAFARQTKTGLAAARMTASSFSSQVPVKIPINIIVNGNINFGHYFFRYLPTGIGRNALHRRMLFEMGNG